AESEHVRPSRQAQVFQSGKRTEAEAFGDEAAGVRTDRQRVELVGRGDAAVQGAGAFGGLGGVLGDGPGTVVSVRSPAVVVWPVARSGEDARVRADRPDAAGAWRLTLRVAWPMAAVSRATVAQAGGAVVGPAGPSMRMMAWKWTTPRRWTRRPWRRRPGPGR